MLLIPLILLLLAANANSKGIMYVVLESEVDSIVSINFCVHDKPCKPHQWVCLAPLSVSIEEPYVYSYVYSRPTVEEARFEVSINDVNNTETLLPLEEFRFPLSRQVYDFTVETFYGPKVTISVVNKCFQKWTGENCTENSECLLANPCKNGKCLISNNTMEVECHCYPGFTGNFCETLIPSFNTTQ